MIYTQFKFRMINAVIPLCDRWMALFIRSFADRSDYTHQDSPHLSWPYNQPGCGMRSFAILIIYLTICIFQEKRKMQMTVIETFLIPLIHVNHTHDKFHILDGMNLEWRLIKIRKIE